MINPQSSSHPPLTGGSPTNEVELENKRLLHALSNKILPIVVFAELALNRCHDDQLGSQIKKIHAAAEQARDILLQLRHLHTQEIEG